MQGSIKVPPIPTNLPEPEPADDNIDIDLGFKDIKNSLKFAIMLHGEYRNEKHSVQTNFISFIVRSQAFTPFDYLVRDLIAQVNYFSGDLSYGYSVFKFNKVRVDAGAGLKYLYVSTKIGINVANKWQEQVSLS